MAESLREAAAAVGRSRFPVFQQQVWELTSFSCSQTESDMSLILVTTAMLNSSFRRIYSVLALPDRGILGWNSEPTNSNP